MKLHGSVGWLIDNDNKIISEYSCYARSRHYGSSQTNINDTKVILILPDFLKIYTNKTMLDIWSQAQIKIQNAQEAPFVGFSLPEYDINIRTLLLPIREVAMKNPNNVKVY